MAQRFCKRARSGGRWTAIRTPRLCENENKRRPCEGLHSSRSTFVIRMTADYLNINECTVHQTVIQDLNVRIVCKDSSKKIEWRSRSASKRSVRRSAWTTRNWTRFSYSGHNRWWIWYIRHVPVHFLEATDDCIAQDRKQLRLWWVQGELSSSVTASAGPKPG
jgi:hypothetical protein